ncbi:hypothetical protein J31TS4_45030 [Paenibacillus sp. J31TS4]|uniref:hypothetical protein n=1 Tax=Paenibacillus sp. J31TS4 TaxID=2807195 RepID=UPI001B08254A|nr:hypothetical protein [Paenibacillus sp. J31TS4]GIP41223.1 hypothetical protein J31TS4_45030 [Paenibacillus sp. J31TS4]
MEAVKLPQPYGLRLEMIRAKGYTSEQIVALLGKDSAEALREQVGQEGNWDGFLDYVREHRGEVETALTTGYRFKFLTIGGVRSLLTIRFGKEEGKDFRFGGMFLEDVRLCPEELAELRELVPRHWAFVEEPGGQGTEPAPIRIQLAD